MRQMYVFNPKVINEQKCREDALRLLRGDEHTVIIHKHKNGEGCMFDVLDVTNIGVQLPHIHDKQCYKFTKGTQ